MNATALALALALAMIRFYERHLSPYKGFSCALSAGTGGASCSAYGHTVIARFRLRRGLGLLDRRLALCGHVHRRMAPPCPAPVHPRRKYSNISRGFAMPRATYRARGRATAIFPATGITTAAASRKRRRNVPATHSARAMAAIARTATP